MHALSGPSSALLDDIRAAIAADSEVARLLQQLQMGALGSPWRMADDLRVHGSHIFVPDAADLALMSSPPVHAMAHEGVEKTLQRLQANFFLPHHKRLVQEFF